jgi:hypothetical protein
MRRRLTLAIVTVAAIALNIVALKGRIQADRAGVQASPQEGAQSVFVFKG